MVSPRTFIPLLLSALSFSAFSATSDNAKPKTFTDPAEAGTDFTIQGEYVGERCAAQVIALGDGKFRIVGWRSGLPGASTEAEKVVEVDATSNGAEATFDSSEWKGKIADSVLTGTSSEGATWSLKKEDRKSPTLGAKAPEGATVLFDGTTADAWDGGKVTPEGFLQAGTKSKQKFGDCTLHIEFRTPFKPHGRGQDRGNSGVYLQDRYEVQVLDSFGLNGENNECGGIYSIAKPKLNMCFPPLTWQTYDIDFESAKYDADGKRTESAFITVRHNGVLIHDRVELAKATPSSGRQEDAESGPIQLQNHGNPVVYRNIWIMERK